jgi:hypothetical protein
LIAVVPRVARWLLLMVERKGRQSGVLIVGQDHASALCFSLVFIATADRFSTAEAAAPVADARIRFARKSLSGLRLLFLLLDVKTARACRRQKVYSSHIRSSIRAPAHT